MDIIENEETDKDIVEENELEELFPKKYDLMTEIEVSLKKTYINKLSGTKTLKYSVILPDNSIEVYELGDSALTRVCVCSGHEKMVTETVFNPNDDNLLFSSSEDGLVKMWDTRAGGSCVLDYKDEEEKIIRPYECVDVSYNGRVLCTGSQLVDDDAYLVFWDQRAPKPLGGYWNCHTDDVTQVKFHKEKVEILATGSVDGLVNVFNIMEQTEEEALTLTLNAECAVDKLAWLGGGAVACLTQAHQLQLWGAGSGRRALHCPREHVAAAMQRSRADDCYLVDAFTSAGGRAVLLAGSYGGNERTLRALAVRGGRLVPYANFARNRQLVRCCYHDQARDLLVTAGEAGVVSVWRGVPDQRADDDLADRLSGIDGIDGDHAHMDTSGDDDSDDGDCSEEGDGDRSEEGDGSEDGEGSDDKSDDGDKTDDSEKTDNSDDSDNSNDSEIPDDSLRGEGERVAAGAAGTGERAAAGAAVTGERAAAGAAVTGERVAAGTGERVAAGAGEGSDRLDSSDSSFESSETEGGEAQDEVSGKLTGALARLQARRQRPY